MAAGVDGSCDSVRRDMDTGKSRPDVIGVGTVSYTHLGHRGWPNHSVKIAKIGCERLFDEMQHVSLMCICELRHRFPEKYVDPHMRAIGQAGDRSLASLPNFRVGIWRVLVDNSRVGSVLSLIHI